MHELAIAQSIVDIVVEQAKTRVVTLVTVVVGDLLSVAEEPVCFCFKMAARGTSAEGATLSLIRVPAAFRCGGCGGEFEVQERGVCPACGKRSGAVVRGRECYVDSIEVKDD